MTELVNSILTNTFWLGVAAIMLRTEIEPKVHR